MKQQSINKSNYYRLFDELAALGRLRRLREKRTATKDQTPALTQVADSSNQAQSNCKTEQIKKPTGA